jgi:hypothetical protein
VVARRRSVQPTVLGLGTSTEKTCKELAALLKKQATAAAERNWSAWGRVYTSLRNRLSLETAEKMVCVKANISSSAATEDSMVTLDHMVVNA